MYQALDAFGINAVPFDKEPLDQECGVDEAYQGFDISDPHFDEAAASSADTRAGLSYARHHLGSLPKVAAVRVLRTWGLYAPHQQIDFESLEGRPRAWQQRGTIMYWVLLPFSIAGAAPWLACSFKTARFASAISRWRAPASARSAR